MEGFKIPGFDILNSNGTPPSSDKSISLCGRDKESIKKTNQGNLTTRNCGFGWKDRDSIMNEFETSKKTVETKFNEQKDENNQSVKFIRQQSLGSYTTKHNVINCDQMGCKGKDDYQNCRNYKKLVSDVIKTPNWHKNFLNQGVLADLSPDMFERTMKPDIFVDMKSPRTLQSGISPIVRLRPNSNGNNIWANFSDNYYQKFCRGIDEDYDMDLDIVKEQSIEFKVESFNNKETMYNIVAKVEHGGLVNNHSYGKNGNKVKQEIPKLTTNPNVFNFEETENKRPPNRSTKQNETVKKLTDQNCGPITLSCKIDGLKGNQIIATIGSFHNQIYETLTKDQNKNFGFFMQKMLEFIEIHEKEFRKHKSDSVAGCAMLIVSSHIGVNKTNFLNALRPQQKNLFKTIARQKKSACYNLLKDGFQLIKKNT